MKKKILLLSFLLCLLLTQTLNAKTPEIMNSLKSHIQTYGVLKTSVKSGSNAYISKISYQSRNKRFLFECAYSNGRSTSSVKMYMPISKKKASYTVYFNETVRAAGRTAKISGNATLRRKTYSDQYTTLRFSRRNGTADARKITNSAYQAAANSLLRYAFKLWESSLENKVTICFRNFGFNNVTVIDPNRAYAYEW